MESVEKLKKYSLEYRSDSNYQELLKIAKAISEDVEGDSQFKSPVEVLKKKGERIEPIWRANMRICHHNIPKIESYKCFFFIKIGHFSGFIE